MKCISINIIILFLLQVIAPVSLKALGTPSFANQYGKYFAYIQHDKTTPQKQLTITNRRWSSKSSSSWLRMLVPFMLLGHVVDAANFNNLSVEALVNQEYKELEVSISQAVDFSDDLFSLSPLGNEEAFANVSMSEDGDLLSYINGLTYDEYWKFNLSMDGAVTPKLFEQGADLPSVLVMLSKLGDEKSIDWLSQHTNLSDYINDPNDEGWSALNIAAKKGLSSIVEKLVAHGARLDVRDSMGWTALALALDNEHFGIARFLIEKEVRVPNTLYALAAEGKEGGIDWLSQHTNLSDYINDPNDEGWIALNIAADMGYLGVVQKLVAHKARLDVRDSTGWTALGVALNNEHFEVARFLIDKGASLPNALYSLAQAGKERGIDWLSQHTNLSDYINEPDDEGWIALHIAADKGYLGVVKKLVAHGAHWDVLDSTGWTALGVALNNEHFGVARFLIDKGVRLPNALYALAQAGKERGIDWLFQNTNISDYVNEPNDHGWSALHIAADKGCLGVVKKLVAHGVHWDVLNSRSWTTLGVALNNEHFDIARFLIDKGVRLPNALYALAAEGKERGIDWLFQNTNISDYVNEPNDHGWSALNIAADKGYLGVVKKLVAHGAHWDVLDSTGWTTLGVALNKEHFDIARFLIDKGVSFPNTLHALAAEGKEGGIDWLSQHTNLSDYVNEPNDHGWSALNIAADKGYLGVVKKLVAHGAHWDVLDSTGWTTLGVALNKEHFDIARFLIDKGVSFPNTLHALAAEGKEGGIDWLSQHTNLSDYVNEPNDHGWLALNIAADMGYLGVVQKLVAHKARLDVRDSTGWTALGVALNNEHFDIARFLIDKGASLPNALVFLSEIGRVTCIKWLSENTDLSSYINNVDDRGDTALSRVASRGHNSVVRLLLENGADIDRVSKSGAYPYEVALEQGHFNTAWYLMTQGLRIEQVVVLMIAFVLMGNFKQWEIDSMLSAVIKKYSSLDPSEDSGRYKEVILGILAKLFERGDDKNIAMLLNVLNERELQGAVGSYISEKSLIQGYFLDKLKSMAQEDYEFVKMIHASYMALGVHNKRNFEFLEKFQELTERVSDVKKVYSLETLPKSGFRTRLLKILVDSYETWAYIEDVDFQLWRNALMRVFKENIDRDVDDFFASEENNEGLELLKQLFQDIQNNDQYKHALKYLFDSLESKLDFVEEPQQELLERFKSLDVLICSA